MGASVIHKTAGQLCSDSYSIRFLLHHPAVALIVPGTRVIHPQANVTNAPPPQRFSACATSLLALSPKLALSVTTVCSQANGREERVRPSLAHKANDSAHILVSSRYQRNSSRTTLRIRGKAQTQDLQAS